MKHNMIYIPSTVLLLFDKFFGSFVVTNFNMDIFSACDCIGEPVSMIELCIQKDYF
jgi:hypothetical protein